MPKITMLIKKIEFSSGASIFLLQFGAFHEKTNCSLCLIFKISYVTDESVSEKFMIHS